MQLVSVMALEAGAAFAAPWVASATASPMLWVAGVTTVPPGPMVLALRGARCVAAAL